MKLRARSHARWRFVLGGAWSGVARVTAQQELPDAVAGAHQVAADVLDRAHEITEVLIGDRRHEREAKLAGGQQPHEPDRVAAVGLDAVPEPLGIDPGATTRTSTPPVRD